MELIGESFKKRKNQKMNTPKFNKDRFKVLPKQEVLLHNFDPSYHAGYENRKDAEQQLIQDIELLAQLQYQLYAENKQAILIVFQAMDAAGKDGAIQHVFSGVNPQGCEVNSFKQPSANELGHDYFWRHYNKLPERGKIGIFNRSHYENVLITKVHPELLLAEKLPGIHSVVDVKKEFWEERYKQINRFERTLFENGTTIIKFFLHLSKEEQKKRFLERIDDQEKNWKFSTADLKERSFWEEYQNAYQTAISKTSTDYAPWYIIPADKKWFSHVAIGNIIVDTLKEMKIQKPDLSDSEKKALKLAKQELLE
jgi:PPK2 family polyphosphate:nucleotide phosphotransferase